MRAQKVFKSWVFKDFWREKGRIEKSVARHGRNHSILFLS
jgi:hypothetical protein